MADFMGGDAQVGSSWPCSMMSAILHRASAGMKHFCRLSVVMHNGRHATDVLSQSAATVLSLSHFCKARPPF